ncbi:Origin recognition complex, subunit 2 [Trachipleistophora hominis]|uniref:Origin recognition complex, subunit 2 n=1 Tax=Trachipleistophora hominis TaxID=72359 RepID=L7JUN5_TRAHO|nr:Origin recognition complex, subunit 2 [Trachipleistophora hominis]
MKKKLKDFHISCVPEYLTFLKTFNILFYGYGDKSVLLREMFPNANFINAYPATLSKSKINIIFKFDLTSTDPEKFPKNNVVCVLDTMDPTAINFCDEDLEDFNFIMKDLTTYVPYENVFEVDKGEADLKNLLNNVPKRSRNLLKIFINLCENNFALITELLNVAKKELFITNTKTIYQLLGEFVDHRIIKYREDKIVLLVKKEKILCHMVN